jgi:DNA-directed RNA polymerase subunit alpha
VALSHLVTPKVECVESEGSHGRFVAEPLDRGFGITVGNALRRVLLGSLQGAAVTWIRIEGIQHEFSTIAHVKEDATEFLLNVKGLRFRPLTGQEGRLVLEVEGEKVVHAGDIKPSTDFEIANPDLYLATLDASKSKLYVEFNVALGKGYVPASHGDGLPIGTIPVDAIFTPVQKVSYAVEPVRTGQYIGYEKLLLDIWTDGTISAAEALSQSSQILKEQFSTFLAVVQAGAREAGGPPAVALGVTSEQYEMPLEKLGLSPRVFNCLRRNKITKVGELLEKSERDLMAMKKLGKKSLEELKQQLQEKGLSLMAEEGDET